MYLQGYQDTTTGPLVQILKKRKNLKIIAPKINYDSGVLWNKIISLAEKHKIDAVIGHSLGGYIGYYISQELRIPALLFAPAFEGQWCKLQPIPKEIVDLPTNKANKIVVMGSKDDDLDVKKIEKLLLGKTEIYEETKMGHQPGKEIFEKYLELFIEKYF